MLFSCCTNFLPCDNKSLPYFCVDFYLRPPRGGQPLHRGGESRNGGISIHALREEGDSVADSDRRCNFLFLSTPSARRATWSGRFEPSWNAISIHALREEGDVSPVQPLRMVGNFYPRPPRGGRPPSTRLRWAFWPNFYPRPPRGGRPSKGGRAPILQTISIHALREEGNQHGAAVGVKYYVFLSTPSARRATRRPSLPPGRLSDFYPRPPRGGRPSGR